MKNKLEIITLSDKFFEDYSGYSEFMEKSKRPYFCLFIELDGLTYASPLRHHFKHPFGFHTIGEGGLDFSKSIVVKDKSYISNFVPRIDTREWKIIRMNADDIISQFIIYLRKYKRALKHKDNPRSQYILKYSTLLYFLD